MKPRPETKADTGCSLERMVRRPAAWTRNLWGVQLTTCCKTPILIAQTWDSVKPEQYPGEPIRALLFYTRRKAREWCAAAQAKYTARSDTCAGWKLTPVRVTETVTPNSD